MADKMQLEVGPILCVYLPYLSMIRNPRPVVSIFITDVLKTQGSQYLQKTGMLLASDAISVIRCAHLPLSFLDPARFLNAPITPRPVCIPSYALLVSEVGAYCPKILCKR